MALIWSRYSGTGETNLDQDYTALSREHPIQQMVQNIEDKVGHDRQVTERELRDQRKNSPYMTMSYVLARYADAEDWFNGVKIGGSQAIELHHVFPKSILGKRYNLRADSLTIDQVANLAFLSRRANLAISNSSPADYLAKIDVHRLKGQYVPLDIALWNLDHFEDFVNQRRTMLADGINKLLSSLSDQPALHPQSDINVLESRIEALEHELRDVVADRLIEARGDSALDSCIPGSIRRSLVTRLQQQVNKNPFVAEDFQLLTELLQFCQFSDYAKIMQANWALFSSDFGDGEHFGQHIKAVTDARNAFAHNRPMSKSDLLSAESGLVWIEECLAKSRLSELEENSDETEDTEDYEEIAIQTAPVV